MVTSTIRHVLIIFIPLMLLSCQQNPLSNPSNPVYTPPSNPSNPTNYYSSVGLNPESPTPNISTTNDKPLIKATFWDWGIDSFDTNTVSMHIQFPTNTSLYVNVTSNTSITLSSITYQVLTAFPDGRYYISVQLTNRLGDRSSNNWSFFIDRTAPDSVITIPALAVNNFPNNGTDIWIQYTLHDNISTILKNVDLDLYDNSDNFIKNIKHHDFASATTGVYWDRKDNSGTVLSNGTYKIYLFSYDHASNKSTNYKSIGFY